MNGQTTGRTAMFVDPDSSYGRVLLRFQWQEKRGGDVAYVQSGWRCKDFMFFICLTSELLGGCLHTAWNVPVLTSLQSMHEEFGNTVKAVKSFAVTVLSIERSHFLTSAHPLRWAPETRLSLIYGLWDKSTSMDETSFSYICLTLNEAARMNLFSSHLFQLDFKDFWVYRC